MSRKTVLTAVVASLFLITLSVNSGFAEKNNSGTKGGGKKAEQTQTTGGMNHGGDHHAGIGSGKEFGQHVRDHNSHFSGTMNPGRHHQGYSGIKGDSEHKK